MGLSFDEEISLIEGKIIRGDYDSALNSVELMVQQPDISLGISLRLALLKARILLDLGEFQKSLVLSINTFQESEQLCERLLMIDAKISIIVSMRYLGRFNEANDIVNETEKLLSETEEIYNSELKLQRARLLLNKGICGRATGNQIITNECVPASLKLFEELQLTDEICDSLEASVMYIEMDKDYRASYNLLLKSLKLRNEIGNKQRIASTHNRLGIVSDNLGLNDQALDHYTKGLAIAKEMKIKDLIGIFTLNIGNIYGKKGQLNKALNYYLQTQEYSSKSGNKHMIAASLVNIANIYLKRGEIEKSLEYNKLALKEFEELNFRQGIAAVLNMIGNAYFSKGNLELASTFLNESLSIRQELDNIPACGDILYNLVAVYLEGGLLKQAKEYHSQLEDIRSKSTLPMIDQLFKISEARLLKSTPRLKNRVKAEELLLEIIDGEILSMSNTIEAYLILCDLLLDELKLIGDRSVLDELTEYIENLFEIAKDQQSHTLLAKSYLLKSQLELINFDVEKAKHLLSQAQFIAEEKELHGLAFKISKEYDHLMDHKDDWLSLAQREAPLNERLALITMDDVLHTMIGNKGIILPEMEQEEPIYLIILNNSGKTIYTQEFQTLTKLDGALVGGFIAALNSFVQQLFNSPGHIERIKHQEYTLVLKIEDELLFTYVYKGQSYTSIKKLSTFIDSLTNETNMWNSLVGSAQTPKMMNEEERDSIKQISETCFLV